ALAEPHAGRPLLDYGCGDGSCLALVQDLFPEAAGADLDAKQTAERARRLADLARLSLIHTDELHHPRYEHPFGLVTCMEVLEHCTAEQVEEVLAQFRRLVAPGGAVLVSVPIEIGPTLLAKEVVRTVAGWRKLGDYATKERYRLGQLLRMTFAGEG